MTFIASYINRTTGEKLFRTVYADSLNEAIRQADKYKRKGFIRLHVEQKR